MIPQTSVTEISCLFDKCYKTKSWHVLWDDVQKPMYR